MGWDRWWWSRHSTNRDCGAVDMTDLLVGLVLLVAIPVVCVFGVELFQENPKSTRGAKRTVLASRDELTLRIREVTTLLNSMIKDTHLGRARSVDDPQLRDYYRKWARTALEECLTKLRDIRFLIDQQPVSVGSLENLRVRTDSLEREAEAVLSQLGGA